MYIHMKPLRDLGGIDIKIEDWYTTGTIADGS